MVFGLFADRSLDGTSAISAPQGIQVREVTAPPDDFGNWGLAAAEYERQKTCEWRHVWSPHQPRRACSTLAPSRRDLASPNQGQPLRSALGQAALERRSHDEACHERSLRTPSVVIFIDVDGLKSVNDKISHLVGDEDPAYCLSGLVLDAVGEVGEVYRLGRRRDQFTLLPRPRWNWANGSANLSARRSKNGAALTTS